MNKKSILSTLLIIAAILAVVNYLVGGLGFANIRFDLTEKNIYTLSAGTKRILVGLEKPVTVRFYATRDSRLMPQWVQGYAATVEDLLLEFEKAADGKITLEKVDPRPDSDEEEKARADDIAGHVANENEDKVYFGLAIQCLDKKEVIPSLSPNEESGLEYMLARAIAKVTKPKKSIIGVMTPMPIAGPAMSQQMMMMMQRQQQQPWAVFTQLRMDYDVREVPIGADKIDADIGILIVVHPADIQERAQFAIDQFLLRGGKVIAFVDPQCAVTRLYSSQGNPMMGQPPSTTSPSSNLKELFKAWGVSYDSDQVVADMTLRTRWQRGPLPTFLTLGNQYINRNEQVTAPLELVQLFSPGAFSLEKKEGISAITLLESSENEMLIDGATAEKAQREPLNNFQSTGRKRILGLRLSGQFKTAFPDGQPAAAPKVPALPGGFPPGGGFPGGFPGGGFPGGPSGESGGAQDDAGAPKPAEKKETPAATAPPAQTPAPAPAPAPAAVPAPAPAATANQAATPPVSVPADAPAPKPAATPKTADETKTTSPAAPGEPAKPDEKAKTEPKGEWLSKSINNEGVIFLFSDADMIFDGFCFQQDGLGRLALLNHNVPLLLNIVEQLNGGADLINVRSRGSTKRAFTKLQELTSEVERKFRPRLLQLQEQKKENEKQLSTARVQQDKSGNLTIILTPEQRKAIDELQDAGKKIEKEEREIRKEVSKGKDRLETNITILNLVAIPLLVIVFGVTFAVRRRSLQAAK